MREQIAVKRPGVVVVKFTQAALEKAIKDGVKKLKAEGKTDMTVFDDTTSGLGLRIRASGAASWVFVYKLGRETKQRKMTLGTFTTLPLPRAQEMAKEMYALARKGEDPAAMKAEKIADAAKTFEIAAKEFLKFKEDKLSTDYYNTTTRHLNVYAKTLHLLPVKGITQPHIATLLTTVREEKGESTADHMRASLSSFFTWAAKEGLMGVTPSNPVTFTHKGEPAERDRVLTLEEMRKIWKATEDQTKTFSQIVRLLMFTLQRRTEIGALDRSETDFDEALIIFPKERMKNGQEHKLPMSGPVVQILNRLPVINDRTLYFGTGEGGFSGWDKAKKSLDERIGPIAHWTLHDLRRTGDTMMNDVLHIDPHVVDAVLHHISGPTSGKAGVAGVYNKAEYIAKKRDALDRWADYILSSVASGP